MCYVAEPSLHVLNDEHSYTSQGYLAYNLITGNNAGRRHAGLNVQEVHDTVQHAAGEIPVYVPDIVDACPAANSPKPHTYL